jgi:hypothetical protein
MQLQPWMHNGVKDIDNEEAQQFAEHIKEKLHV